MIEACQQALEAAPISDESSPPRAAAMAFGHRQTESAKGFQIPPGLPLRQTAFDVPNDFPQGKSVWGLRKHSKDQLLSFGEVSRHTPRGRVPAGAKTDDHTPTMLFNLRRGASRYGGELEHFDGASAPCLDNSASVQGLYDQRIPGL